MNVPLPRRDIERVVKHHRDQVSQAIESAVRAADLLGIPVTKVALIADVNNFVVRLSPEVVAKVALDVPGRYSHDDLSLELRMCNYLASVSAPTARPCVGQESPLMIGDAQVVLFESFGRQSAAAIDRKGLISALQDLHGHMSGFPGPLPLITDRLRQARNLVEEPSRVTRWMPGL